jgi:plasmid stability protein
MASITIRNLDDQVKEQLRVRAALHGVSMEEEARRILRTALDTGTAETGLGSRIADLWSGAGGWDIPEFERSLPRRSPFGDPNEE